MHQLFSEGNIINTKNTMKRKKMEDCLIFLSNFPRIIFLFFFLLTGMVYIQLFVI